MNLLLINAFSQSYNEDNNYHDLQLNFCEEAWIELNKIYAFLGLTHIQCAVHGVQQVFISINYIIQV